MILRLFTRKSPHELACDRLEADRCHRELTIGIPYAKRREAALRGRKQGRGE